MANAVSGRTLIFAPSAVGVQTFNLFDLTGPSGSSLGWAFQVGIREEFVEGNPAPPSLVLTQPGAWRFRWGVTSGAHSIAVFCKQTDNAAPYPSLVVKANPAIGIAADITGTSPGGASWVTIGPVPVVPSSAGVLWVELWNNFRGNYNLSRTTGFPWSPCYFDHIVLV